MVHPRAFKGLCKDFLMGEKADFAAAIEEGYTRDALAHIQRRFFKRFPLDLAEGVEPSPEHLATLDDDKPDKQVMMAERYNEAVKNLEDRRHLLQFRKGVSDFQLLSRWCRIWECPDAKNKVVANKTLADLPIHEGQQF